MDTPPLFWKKIWQHARLFFFDTRVIFGLILLAGLATRVTHLTTSFWGDEGLSYMIVKHFPNIRELVDYVAWIEVHPPLYYITLHYWIKVVGTTEMASRLLSVIFGVGIVALAYRLAMELFRDQRVARIGAFLVAVLPLQILITQDARPYAIMTFLGLLATLAYWRYRTNRHWSSALVYIIASLLGIYFHYSSFFITAALSSFWLLEALLGSLGSRSRAFVIWLSVHAAIVFGFAPWLPFVLYKLFLRSFLIFDRASAPVPPLRPLSAPNDLMNRLIWVTKGKSITIFELAAIWIFKITALWMVIRFFIREKLAPKLSLTDRWPLYYLLWIFVVCLVLFLPSPQSYPYTPIPERHILYATVPFALLLAYLIVQSGRRLGSLLLALFAVSLLTSTVNAMSNPALDDNQYQIKNVAEYINELYRPGDLIITQNAFFRTDLNMYLREDLQFEAFYPTNYLGLDWYSSRETLGLVENETQFRVYQPPIQDVLRKFDYLAEKHQAKRIWLVYFYDPYGNFWAILRDWRFVFQSPFPLLPVTLIERPGAVQ